MPFRGAKRSLNARYDSLQDEVGLSKPQPAKQLQQTYDHSRVRLRASDKEIAGAGLDLSRFRHDPTSAHTLHKCSPLQDLGEYFQQQGSHDEDMTIRRMACKKAEDFLESEYPPEDYTQQSHWFSSSQHPSFRPDPGAVMCVSTPPATTSEHVVPFSRNPKRVLDESTSSPVLHRPFGRRVNRLALTAPRPRLLSQLPVEDENQETWLSDADLLEAMRDEVLVDLPRPTPSSRMSKTTAPQKKQLYISDAEAQYKRACDDSTLTMKTQAPVRRRKRTFDTSIFASREKPLDTFPALVESEALKTTIPEDSEVIELSSSDGPEPAKSSTHVVQESKRQRPNKATGEREKQAERCAEKKDAFFSVNGVFVPSWAQWPSPTEEAPEQRRSRLEAVLMDNISDSEDPF